MKTVSDGINIIENRKTNVFLSKEAADSYDTGCEPTNLWFDEVIFPLFCRHINAGDRVLDVACGTGRVSINLAKYGCNVTGIDISPHMMKHLNEKILKYGLSIDVVEGNAKKLPFNDDTFDAVVSMWFLQHFANWQEFLTEQIRVVKKSGIIGFEFSFKEHEYLAHSLVANRISQYIYSDDVDAGAAGKAFYATTTMPELTEYCKETGVSIEAIMPHSFFDHNAFLMDATTIDLCRKAKNEIYPNMVSNDDVLKYARYYESEMISKMPFWYTRRCIVILKKIR